MPSESALATEKLGCASEYSHLQSFHVRGLFAVLRTLHGAALNRHPLVAYVS